MKKLLLIIDDPTNQMVLQQLIQRYTDSLTVIAVVSLADIRRAPWQLQQWVAEVEAIVIEQARFEEVRMLCANMSDVVSYAADSFSRELGASA